MKVSEKQIHIESTWFSAERDVKRTQGLHLSHVIDFIEAQQGKGRERSPDGKLSDAGNAYACAGFLWERVLEATIEYSPTELFEWLFSRAMVEPVNPVVVRPGEQWMDAGECPICAGKGVLLDPVRPCERCGGIGRIVIYMTPDGYHIEDEMLEEWKYTTKSARNDINGPKFRRWVAYQIPCYLKSLNLTQCRLRVYFARGDYTDGVPIWKEYILTYTKQELEETWDCIAINAISMSRIPLITKEK